MKDPMIMNMFARRKRTAAGWFTILLLLVLMNAGTVQGSMPGLTIRFGNLQYNCADQTCRVDVELKADSAGRQLFGLNLRFFYDDDVLEYQSAVDFVTGYALTDVPQVSAGMPGSGAAWGFPTGHPVVFFNGAVQYSGNNPVVISPTGWTRIFSMVFHVDDQSAWAAASFCPSLVWDLSEGAGFMDGDEGVVLTIAGTSASTSLPVSESAQSLNWQLNPTPGATPFGSPTTTTCITTAPPDAPSVAVTPPDCMSAAGTITVTAPAGQGMTYSIDGINYNNSTGIFTQVPTGTYAVTVKSPWGCISDATSATMVPGPAARVSGFVLYDNNPALKLSGVTVQLKNATGTVVATAVSASHPVTGEPGYFAFCGVPDGTGYKITGTYNGTWGGNNATDALLVQLEAGNPGNVLSGLRRQAADVNSSTSITALDALFIKLRTVGSISSYPAGDWKISEEAIDLSGPAVAKNLGALCYGDVNGSYDPFGSKAANYLKVVEEGVIYAGVDESFTYTLRSTRDARVGAVTLFMDYDPGVFELTGIADAGENLKYSVRDGRVAIAWADDRHPIDIRAGEVLLTMNMKLRKRLDEPVRVFTLTPGSEIADVTARPYDDFGLKMAGVLTPGGDHDITLSNFPNPFSASTSLIYSLPADGKVKLVVTDIYGKTLSTPADGMEKAGIHTVSVSAADLNLAPGVYLGKLTFDDGSTTTEKVCKMVCTK